MIEFISGEIPYIEGDLLINAANGRGWMGGVIGRLFKSVGVAQSIHYADPSIEKITKKLFRDKRVSVGDTVHTTAGKLNYSCGILHAITMAEPGQSSSLDIVAKCLDNMLSYCDKNKIEVVVIPLLGTGVGGLNKESVLDLYEKKLENSRTTFKVIHYKK